MTTKCAGLNCTSTDGKNHSPECIAEHAAAVAGGRFVKLTDQSVPSLFIYMHCETGRNTVINEMDRESGWEEMNPRWQFVCEAVPAASGQRPTDDALWDQTLQERDGYHEWADKLANAIGLHLGVDIGEHSSANNPWNKALDAIMAAPGVAELTDDQWINLAQRHVNADWNSEESDGYLNAVRALCNDFRALLRPSSAIASDKEGA